MSIGYEIQVFFMNILIFYNVIVNNGVMVWLKFVKVVIKNGEIVKEYFMEIINLKICLEWILKQIQEIFYKVVYEGLVVLVGFK